MKLKYFMALEVFLKSKRNERAIARDIDHIMHHEMTGLEVILMFMTLIYLIIGAVIGVVCA